eukprot:255212_1
MEDVRTKKKHWGYKSIRHLFVRPHLSMLDFGLVQTMFPSLQEIVIEKWFEILTYKKKKKEATPGGEMMNDLLQMIYDSFKSGAASKLRNVVIKCSVKNK